MASQKKREIGYNKEFKFFAQDFWSLIEKQKYKCALTGRELTPHNTEVELREPRKEKGRADMSNHYLVDRDVSPLCRNLSQEEISKLALEIVKNGKPKSAKKRK